MASLKNIIRGKGKTGGSAGNTGILPEFSIALRARRPRSHGAFNYLIMRFAMAALSILSLSSCIYHPSSMVDIGQIAPSFNLLDLDGGEISLEKYRGKIVLLDFWATWCAPCRMTMPVVEKLAKEYSNDMVLLAVNMLESKDVVEKYVFDEAIISQVLLDAEGTVGAAYGARSIPMQFLIDRSGVVRHIQTGYNSKMSSQLRAQIEQLR